jgi:hypothetical protein
LDCAGAPALSVLHQIMLDRGSAPPVMAPFVENLFARQSRFHLIKLLETTALHAYATTI